VGRSSARRNARVRPQNGIKSLRYTLIPTARLRSMRRTLPSFFRYIAFFLVLTLVSSGMAMASYVCPQLTTPSSAQMMEGLPCSGMDVEKPAHCASFKTDAKASPDHLNVAPALTSPSLAVLFRVLLSTPPTFTLVSWVGTTPEPYDDPPYLRTLRITV
jgi:hypothetical protein